MKERCPQLSPLATSLLRAVAAVNGLRATDEYFTLEGHLQMWCDMVGWEWSYDRERDVFRFGKLVGKKQRRCRQVVLQCVVDGEGMNVVVREFVREPRLKEKNIEEVAA